MFLPIGPNRKTLDDPPRVWRWRMVGLGLTSAVFLTPEYVLKPLGVFNPNGWIVRVGIDNGWMGLSVFPAALLGSLALIWSVERFLEKRVYRRLQAERVCIRCFYCLDHGNPENPLCPECGFSKTVSDVLRKQFRWGKWANGATFTRREREPGRYATGGGVSTHVRLPYGTGKAKPDDVPDDVPKAQ